MRRLLASLLGLAAACTERPTSEDTDGDTTTAVTTSATASTTADVPTGGTTDEDTAMTEPCLEQTYNGESSPAAWMLTCNLPELCPGAEPLMFEVESDLDLLEPGAVTVDDLERARCMLEALRDRTQGHVTWDILLDDAVVRAAFSLEIVLDRVLVHSARFPVELIEPGPHNIHERYHQLRESEFFHDCLAGDAKAVFLCLVDAAVPECLPGPLLCPP